MIVSTPDRAGFRALSLFGGTGPTLVLYDRGASLLSPGPEAPDMALRVETWRTIPVLSHTCGSVILVSSAWVLRRALRTEAVLSEIQRVLRADGVCILVVVSRSRAQYLSKIRLVRWSSGAETLKAQASRRGLNFVRIIVARLDDFRIREVELRSSGVANHSRATLDLLFEQLEKRLGLNRFFLDRLLVRRIGKTIAIASTSPEHRFVVRIPLSHVACQRARTNEHTLVRLQAAGWLSEQRKALLPRPLGSGMQGPYKFFAETHVPGRPGEERISHLGWEGGALQFITDFHAATRVQKTVSPALFAHHVAEPLSAIGACCEPSHREILRRLNDYFRDMLLGGEMPFVWTHGDFALGNCLYARDGSLSGVIDWELSASEALPLLDVLHCMHLPNESHTHDVWPRALFFFDLFSQQGSASLDQLRRYSNAVQLRPELIKPLLLMYWVDHVAKRMNPRATDMVWLRKRVVGPLERIATLPLH